MVNPTSANEIYTELQDAFSKAYPADSDQVLRRLAELIAPLYNGRVTYRRNVLDFGAVPDGVTDCQPAFLAARNSIPSGSTGEILVPRVEGAVNTSDAGASTWALAIVADTTNGGAGFEVTGTGSFNVMATLDVVETVG